MASFFDQHPPEIQDLLLRCMKSTKLFAKTFFPDDVSAEFNILHDKLFEVIDHPVIKKKAAAAPRGLGKTTIAKIRAVKAIVFRETNFIVYLSNSETSAVEQTEHIKRMLLENELIIKLFGKVTFSDKGFKEGFSKQSWVAYGDVYVLPRGSGQQVRGKNWMGHRPGLFIVDDLETTEGVRSPDQRLKLSDWFFSDLMKSESKFGERAEFIYIDTVKHTDSLLQNLIDSDDWLKVNTPDKVLAICDAAFNTYDPNYMTTEEIKIEYENHRGINGKKDKTDLFYMEYMNIPISLKDAVFKEEYLRYFEERGSYLLVRNSVELVHHMNTQGRNLESVEKIPVNELITVVIGDPAKTVKMHSAESAIIVCSVHRKSHKIFIREAWSDKVRPDKYYDELFRCVLTYRARFLAVEITGLNEYISQPIKQQMKLRSIFPIFIELNAKGDKDLRISNALAPQYKMGYIYHNTTNCSELETQLKWHPKSKLKDLIDAESYITWLIDNNYLYFESEEDDDGEDEFFDLIEDLDEDLESIIGPNYQLV